MLYEMLSGERAIRGENLLDVLREIDAFDAARACRRHARAVCHDSLPAPWWPINAGAIISMAEIAELLNWRDYSLA